MSRKKEKMAADAGDAAYFIYDLKIGKITISSKNEAITRIEFGEKEYDGEELCRTKLLDEAFVQLQEYLDKKRQVFSLPLRPEGTDFERAVWKALQTIPYGETRYYAQIAELSGSPKAARAVGMANHKNPIAIVIPCHRVIGKNKKLVGYGGGLELKKYLLDLEQ